jgi:hypothetical protein
LWMFVDCAFGQLASTGSRSVGGTPTPIFIS